MYIDPWKELKDGSTGYYYTGDMNTFDHGGLFINPTTGHVIEIWGSSDTYGYNKKGKEICEVFSVDIVVPRKVNDLKQAFRSSGMSIEDLPKDRLHRRLALMEILFQHGCKEPAFEYETSEYYTHREVACIRVVNRLLRR